MIESRGGRHRKEGGPPEPRDTPRRDATSAETPTAYPPHPPLVSGGWYRDRTPGEVPGPGRYPVQLPADRSVGAAFALSMALGPLGICYTSVTAGLIATGVALVALLVFGYLALLVVWPLAIAAAVLGARVRHRRYRRT